MLESLDRHRERIEARLERASLGRVAVAIQGFLRPSIRWRLGKVSSEPVIRLGGLPNLPADIPWPARNEGQPLSFVAQFDLSQFDRSLVESVEGLPLPPGGSLFFFWDAYEAPWGWDPGDTDGFKVVFSPLPLATSPVRKPPYSLDSEYVFKGYALEPTVELTAPGFRSDEVEELRLSGPELEAYRGLFESETMAHRMGGYADHFDGSLELVAELVSHGIVCGGSEGFEEGRRRKLGAGAADWRLLLQIDSEREAGMCWSDMGRIFFLIREQDLRELRFDRIRVNLHGG